MRQGSAQRATRCRVLVGALAAIAILGESRAIADDVMLPPGRVATPLSLGSDPVGTMKRLSRDAKVRTSRAASDTSEPQSHAVSKDELRQVLVIPERPGRNNVHYYDFTWRRYDMLDDDGIGGVRLYYYDREEEIARVAAAYVREQYDYLAEKFDYRPTNQVPYILYNSHREFEATNVFFVNEYILGVTSPLDLRMALPYWGESELFRQVSTHEMTHQFTIQKLADRAAALGVDSPIGNIPLWFVEGLAEYYAKHGLDKETDMFARDMLVNQRPEKGYAVIQFWDDYPGAFLYTYKLGQLRVAFLADTYGERIVQGILDQAPRLGGAGRQSSTAPGASERENFQELVGRLAGEKPEAVAQRFQSWMKHRYLPSYLGTKQEPPTIAQVEIQGEPDGFATGRDGLTVLYRAVERDSGRARLFLSDRRDKESATQVAVDGEPGIESLHPVLRSVMAVGTDRIAFLARHGSADALYVVPFKRIESEGTVRFELGERQVVELVRNDILEAGDPTFSPSGNEIAFFGLDGSGRIDVFTCELATGRLTQITNDVYAERDLSWVDDSPEIYGVPSDPTKGPERGTIVYAGDATETRRYNLFALDPRSGVRERLTDEKADHRAPCALGGGLVAFASDDDGKQDLHLYDASKRSFKRITDFVTSLGSPSPGPRGLMALGFYAGQYQVFDVATDRYLDLDEKPARGAIVAPPAAIPQEPIPPKAPLYEPFSAGSWRLENAIGAVGTASVGQGALLFGDVLSDRNVVVQLAVFGSLRLTDAVAFYSDRSRRLVIGGGPFHTFTRRRELNAPGFNADVDYLQREFGLTGFLSYPLDTYTRIEARAVAQGETRDFSFAVTPDGFADLFVSTAHLRDWNQVRGGIDLETLAAFRFGYDTTRFRFPGGAFGGSSLVTELGAGYLPFRHEAHRYGYLDAQTHFRVIGSTVLHVRAAGGWSAGSVFGRQFYLSSYDNLRAYGVSDRRLLGTMYGVGNADFAIPLDSIIRIALFSNVAGIIGADIGAVSNRTADFKSNLVLDYVLGVNLGLGPFEFRLHWAKPIDIGGAKLPDAWVPNVSLRYAYF